MVLYDTLISLCLAPNLISCSNISHLFNCLISFGYICIKVSEETYTDPEGNCRLNPTFKNDPDTECRFSSCEKQGLIPPEDKSLENDTCPSYCITEGRICRTQF